MLRFVISILLAVGLAMGVFGAPVAAARPSLPQCKVTWGRKGGSVEHLRRKHEEVQAAEAVRVYE